jgi:hypothetical protein
MAAVLFLLVLCAASPAAEAKQGEVNETEPQLGTRTPESGESEKGSLQPLGALVTLSLSSTVSSAVSSLWGYIVPFRTPRPGRGWDWDVLLAQCVFYGLITLLFVFAVTRVRFQIYLKPKGPDIEAAEPVTPRPSSGLSWPPPIYAGGRYVVVTVANPANVLPGVYTGPAFENVVQKLGGLGALYVKNAPLSMAHFCTYMTLEPAVKCMASKSPASRVIHLQLW